uniref:Uncharacterized protein n=1 Tax=Rhizophora mucronata TaxID=61149 RepID=A0A2P2P5Q5_RHIMU
MTITLTFSAFSRTSSNLTPTAISIAQHISQHSPGGMSHTSNLNDQKQTATQHSNHITHYLDKI